MSETARRPTPEEIEAFCVEFQRAADVAHIWADKDKPPPERAAEDAAEGSSVTMALVRTSEDLVEALRTEVAALTAERDAAVKRAEVAERKLDLICDINEDDWEDGEAASWVHKIMCGESLDGMVTQEQLEESYCTSCSRSST